MEAKSDRVVVGISVGQTEEYQISFAKCLNLLNLWLILLSQWHIFRRWHTSQEISAGPTCGGGGAVIYLNSDSGIEIAIGVELDDGFPSSIIENADLAGSGEWGGADKRERLLSS